MISYPFIQELFTNILSKSKAIQGRLFLCPRMGSEMNSDELGQVIQDLVIPEPLIKKYPLALMMPPFSEGDYTGVKNEWDRHRFTIFFLTTTYYSGGTNQIINPNPKTRTSTHTITQDWHDMKRAALGFIKVLYRVMKSNQLMTGKFRLEQETTKKISPISFIGVDRASGVSLDFMASIFNDCGFEDYELADIATIEIPNDDSHPEHQL